MYFLLSSNKLCALKLLVVNQEFFHRTTNFQTIVNTKLCIHETVFWSKQFVKKRNSIIILAAKAVFLFLLLFDKLQNYKGIIIGRFACQTRTQSLASLSP